MQKSNRNDAPDARIDQDQIAALYDRLAPVYDIWAWLTESRARTRALELAEIEDGQHSVEIAVGTGYLFTEIVKRNPHGTNIGIDLSPGMLAKAAKRLHKSGYSNYTLEIGSAFSLSLADNSTDLLLNSYMIDLIPFQDMGKILAEFGRVLKRDGKLILLSMTHGEHFGSGIYQRLFNLSPEAMGGCRAVAMTERLAQHGFEVVRREYIQQMLFPSEVILARPLA